MMERWAGSGWKLPALSGLLLGSGYYTPLLIPNFFAFVPLLYWLDRNPEARCYLRFRTGIVLGLSAHMITLHFFYSLLDFTWLAALLYVGFALALAVRIGLSVALLGWLRRGTGFSFGLLLPLAWIPLEWSLAFGDLRMTGDHLAHTLAGYPFLIQFADLVGHYGVGGFMLCANGLIYGALLERGRPARRRAATALAVLVVLVLGYDLWAWIRPRQGAETIRVAIVQPDIPLVVKHGSETESEQSLKLAELTRRAAAHRPDLIVWPETARPEPLLHWLNRPQTYAMAEVQALSRELRIPLLVGVEYYRVRDAEDYELYNAAMLVGSQGELSPAWAAKVYLVPFVEAMPFRRVLGPLVDGRGGEWHWIAGAFSPGPPDVLLDVDGARVGVLVCFEQLFPDLARRLRNAGAELQVVVTNDAWFGRTLFQRFQANVLRLRAVENRSAFVRVANTGISGFVDRYGRYERQTPLFETAVAVGEVELSTERTPYDRVGDVVVWLMLAGLFWTAVPAFRGIR